MSGPIVDARGNVVMPENPIILSTGPLVGLGDWALYSTLPKRFTELGYEVWFDQDNRARNDEILDLFEHNNPYFKGSSDRKPNAGYPRQGLYYELTNRYPIGSIEAMERAHGLPPPYSLAPWASYEPKPFPFDVREHVLVDFSAISSHIGDQGIGEFLGQMKARFRNAPFLQVLLPKWTSLQPPRIAVESIAVNSIYEYLDALAMCKGWVGSEAGGQSLAALARGEHPLSEWSARPHVAVLSTPKTFNSRGYVYAGVDYRVSQFIRDVDRNSDWWSPHEVSVHNYELQCAASYQQMRSLA